MGSKDDFAQVPIPVSEERLLSKVEFQRLADVPPEAEWFANLTNENTKRAYRNDVTSFMRFVGIERPEDFRSVTRAHVIAWRKTIEKRKLAPATVRRKLSAQRIRALFDCLKNIWRRRAIAVNRMLPSSGRGPQTLIIRNCG
jgi:hypothetical protein